MDGVVTVSVLMGVRCTRGDTSLLRRSVDSILAQTFRDFELLICDDGSCEAARLLLDELAAADPRVRLLRPGGAVSLPAKLNVCLREAGGEYVARMDDDDYSRPERFAAQLRALNDNPGIAFCGICAELWRDGERVGRRELPERPEVRDFFMTQPFIHPSLMFRREALDAVGGYCEEPRCDRCEDYDLLLRLYAAGYRGMNLKAPLFDYTAPDARGNRTLRHRWNEAVTRWVRFSELGLLPRALPYVIKPLAVGLLPTGLLRRIKERS